MLSCSVRCLHVSLPLVLLTSTALMMGSTASLHALSGARAPHVRTGDGEARVSLVGNTHPLARPEFDRGPASPEMAADRMLLILRRSPQQEDALQAWLTSVQNPVSPEYHKFVTPEQFGKLYGPGDVELDTIKVWLKTQGFAVDHVNKGRTAIEFSGTVSELQEAFHTSIHKYLIGDQVHLANASDPSIPVSLAPVVAGIANLNDFKPTPNIVRGPRGKWNAAAHRFQPDLTLDLDGTNYLFVVPGDAATIYNSPNSLNVNLATGQAIYDGTGVTIGVVGNTNVDVTHVAYYRNFFGLPANPVTVVYDGTQANIDSEADDSEAMIDTELSGGLAPGANIIYYTAGDTLLQSGVFLAMYRAIEDNNVGILSVSFGECEFDLAVAGNLEVQNAWEQAAAQGIAVTVSSGDSGSAGCDDENYEVAATTGLAVNGLASTPYNIAVGGTDYDILAKQFSMYVSGTSSTADYSTALSYIPENPWNDSSSTNGVLASNTPNTAGGQTNIVAGGGGASSWGKFGAGTPAYVKPAWQKQFPPSDTDTNRDLPDVSLLAADGMYNALWTVCGDDDCGSSATVSGFGGTSTSAPAFAGILALINQKMGASTRLGQPNWVLYQLASTSPSAFHQVMVGNNSVYCTSGSTNCGTNSFLTGYNAGSGYNLATGLGSVDISKLVNSWGDASLTQTKTTLSLNKTSFKHGTAVNVTTTVVPASAAGDVSITNNSGAQNGAVTNSGETLLTLASGTASGSYTQFPGGTYNVYANYGGDKNDAGSTSTAVQVTVTPEDSIIKTDAEAYVGGAQWGELAGASAPFGLPVAFYVEPIGKSQASVGDPATDATGTVYLTDTMPGNQGLGAKLALDSTGYAFWMGYPQAGAHSVTAQYAGDLSYNQSTSAPVNFSITQAPTAIAITSGSATVNGENENVTAEVTSSNIPANLIAMNGTVTFTNTTTNTLLGSSPVLSSSCASASYLCYSVDGNFQVTQFLLGANSVVVSYSGDNNFLASGPSAAITITCTAGCSNSAGQSIQIGVYQISPPAAIAPGGNVTAQVGMTGNGGFTGAVNVTCGVTGPDTVASTMPACALSPAQVSITSAQPVVTALSITTVAATNSSRVVPPSPFPWIRTGGAVLAVLLLFGLPGRRSRRRALLSGIILLVALASVAACGGGGSGGGGGGGGGKMIPGTPAGVYTILLYAADAATGKVTAQSSFTVTVQ